VLVAVFLALLFDGFELGLMPIASLSVTKSLLGEAFNASLGGEWFARFTASLMLGAAIGGIALGRLGDAIGRARALSISVFFYSIFAWVGAHVTSQEQMLLLRFFVGLGVGGMWPNGIALVSECWPGTSRATVSGLMMAGLNLGIFILSQLASFFTITPDSWRWLFQLAGIPALFGLFLWFTLPESRIWKETIARKPLEGENSLLDSSTWRNTLVCILLCSIPLVGAWSASKWMIPWADSVAGAIDIQYKAKTQACWAIGAVIGSVLGSILAASLGRRLSYFLVSIATFSITLFMFQGSYPLHGSFLWIVFFQGLCSTLFFGWMAYCVPEFFPARLRASGSGLAYNFGRFITCAGVLASGMIFVALGNSYSHVGAVCSSVYALGALLIWLAPISLGSRSSELE
jgi:MFS transporter, SHS family, sialic acid transporter